MFGTESPTNFRMTRKRARARAGSIYQNPLELHAEGKRQRGVQFERAYSRERKPFELRPHGAETVRVAVRGDHQSFGACRTHERRRLAAGSCAEVENAISSLYIKEQRHSLRSFVLNR